VDRWLDDLARAAAGGRLTRRTVPRRLLPGALAGVAGVVVGRRLPAAEVQVVCSANQLGGCFYKRCSSDNDCPSGYKCGCAPGQTCGQNICLAPSGANCYSTYTQPPPDFGCQSGTCNPSTHTCA
jgi:hypothetical protein